MSDDVVAILILVAIVGSGVVGGIFFAFSTFVMQALKQIPDLSGMLAMQRINVTVINPLFMLVFLVTPAICLVLGVNAVINLEESGSEYVLAGSIIHIVGSLLVTIIFNVPRNNVLAKVDADSDEGVRQWGVYVSQWTRWNHVRTTAAIAAAVLLGLGLHWQN